MTMLVHFAGSALGVADSKGRFALPLNLRNKVKQSSGGENRLYLGADETTPILRGFGQAQLDDLANEMRLDEENAVRRNLSFDRRAEQRRRFGTIEEVGFDEGGRFFLPDALREYASITDKIMFVGAFSAIELWAPERLLATEVDNPAIHIACRKALADIASGAKGRKGAGA